MPNQAGTCQPGHMTVTQEGQARLHGRPKEPSGPSALAMGPPWLEGPAPGLSWVQDKLTGRPRQLTHLEDRAALLPAAQVICKQKTDLFSNHKCLVHTYRVSGTVLGTQWGRSWKHGCYSLPRPQEGWPGEGVWTKGGWERGARTDCPPVRTEGGRIGVAIVSTVHCSPPSPSAPVIPSEVGTATAEEPPPAQSHRGWRWGTLGSLGPGLQTHPGLSLSLQAPLWASFRRSL